MGHAIDGETSGCNCQAIGGAFSLLDSRVGELEMYGDKRQWYLGSGVFVSNGVGGEEEGLGEA